MRYGELCSGVVFWLLGAVVNGVLASGVMVSGYCDEWRYGELCYGEWV